MDLKTIMYIIVFVVIHIALFIYGFLKQKNDPELQVLNRVGYSVMISRAAGLVLALDMAILLLPVCRNIIRMVRSSLLNKIIPFDENILFHKLTAFSLLFFTVIHTEAHYRNFFVITKFDLHPEKSVEMFYTSWAGATGHLMIFIMFLMYISAHLQVRKETFETFWYIHHLYFIFYFAFFFHAMGCVVKSSVNGSCKGYKSYIYALPGFLLYFIERIIREVRARQDTRMSLAIFHPGNTVEIRFEKPSFVYRPGQYLYINVPEISWFQWHPFTISSCPEEGFVSLHIRVVGDWTRALKALLEKRLKAKSGFPKIMVDGPFGAPAEDLFNYETAVLVSAGIGVTPSAALLKSVWFAFKRKAPMRLKKLYFIWVNRNKEDFGWFQSLLSALEKAIPKEYLEIHVYLTGNLKINDIENIIWNTKEKDAVTELDTKTKYGRPSWSTIFNHVKKMKRIQKAGDPNIGVFFCGPAPMAKAVVDGCKKHSDERNKFIPHLEHF